MQRLKDSYIQQYVETNKVPITLESNTRKSKEGIIVDGIEDCPIKFAQCCNPLPGDDVVGFITRGHGVSVHKKDCANYRSAMLNGNEPERWISVSWAESKSTSYRTTLNVVAFDRGGLLADIAIILSEMRIFIHESTSRELKNGNADLSLTISIAGIDQLNTVISRIKKVRGVISVDRSGK